MSTKIKGGSNTAGEANVDSKFQLLVKQANPVEINGTKDIDKVGSSRMMSEVDAGTVIGQAVLIAPYVDQYFRTYVSDANLLDSETFNYTAQNTGKHILPNTTMAAAFAASGFTTNSGGITTTATGVALSTRAMFSMFGNTNLDAEMVGSFSNQPVSNTNIDFGFFHNSGANPYAPSDGAYFRLTAAGFVGVVNNNGTEITTGVFPFVYVNNQKYRFYISATVKGVQFWITDILYNDLVTPQSLGQPFMSAALPFAIRHAIVGGAASAVLQAQFNQYSIINAGVEFSDSLGTVSNRVLGSYQGLSGGSMGSLASYANGVNPTPAVPTNTTSLVCTGLGGQGWETDTAIATLDGIIMSYQVPAGSANVLGKRLKIIGFRMSSYVQTALTGGGYNAQFAICFGHTAVSLAITESATTKAPRRIALGSYSVAAGLAALVQLPDLVIDLSDAPIYVNPGEFFAIAKKKVGTAPSAGVIAYTFTPIYSWE